jgi:butyrate kinase
MVFSARYGLSGYAMQQSPALPIHDFLQRCLSGLLPNSRLSRKWNTGRAGFVSTEGQRPETRPRTRALPPSPFPHLRILFAAYNPKNQGPP